ncbi:MAG: AbrB/MazE/SpoVT family DNA-binding domain-containing protein [Verrucomicrobia bacterium]|nr:AbrB/MazE/SpoVT family DNA-binding domain-containing protein [Verrucomicrobiota bacterium]
MTTLVQLDGSNRIVLPLELRRAAGVPRGQKLKASATPGRIVLEMEPVAQGKVVKRGKLKVWSGRVPVTPLAEAVEAQRRGVMGGGIYDSLDATFARRMGARRIVTRNPSHFAHAAPDLEILTP